MIRLAFRLDDPSLTSDHDLEAGILDCFAHAGVPLTCAVVPFACDRGEPRPLTADAVPHLMEASREGRVEVALHGHCHRSLARLRDGNDTEFAGIHKQVQRAALILGRERLQTVFDTDIDGFVPPWNSYDATTLDLLAALGFRWLSADWALVTDAPLPFPVLPHTCNLPHLEQAVAEARSFGSGIAHILVILHHFDFAESGNANALLDLERLDRLLAWVTAQPDIACSSVGALAAETPAQQCRRNLLLAGWRRRLHWRLQTLFPRYLLLGGDGGCFAWTVGRGALTRLPRLLTG